MYKLNPLLLAVVCYSTASQAFVPTRPCNKMVTSFVLPQSCKFRMSSSNRSVSRSSSSDVEETDNESMSFDDAGAALVDEDEKQRAERSGSGLTEEKNIEFEAKKSEYESMREKIRSRASSLNIEKSVTTQKAIEEANRRAMAREDPQEIDLSKFGMGSIGEDPEDELSDEQMAKIDKASSMNILDQALEEFKNAKFPGVGATLRQTAFMLVIFAFTATYILFLDGFIRDFFTDVLKLIPAPDAVFDYSDLDLPDGWTDMMDETDIAKQ